MRKSTLPSEIFPERLKRARELRDLTQSALAEHASLQPSAISHFETGNRKPSFDNLRRLARALDVTTDYLLGRADKPGGPGETDELHRHIEALTSTDREIARDFVEVLAKRSKSRKRRNE